MIFNDFGFLFVFLPVVLALFFVRGLRALRPYVLVAASLIFYGISGVEHAIVLAVEVLWVYAIVTRPLYRASRVLFLLAVVPPVLALIYYKYLGFLVGTFIGLDASSGNEEFSLFMNVVLPAGISFFTFQLISFAIDHKRGEIDDMPTLPHFAAYIMLFPQLVAGPILRYRDIAVPLRHLEHFQLTGDLAAKAIGYVTMGLAAKVLVADSLSNYIAPYRDAPGLLSQTAAFYTTLAYSFQIYMDFYGYSLIAIGLGALFGFDYPHNFKRPYEAKNPREFWRRWHITLSFWIRDYLYVPLGGNRSYVRNMVIVMALCGLWHGAGWSFVVWGLYHAGLTIAYHYGRHLWDRLPGLVQQVANFSLVSFGWLFFLFDFEQLGQLWTGLFSPAALLRPDPSVEMWVFLLASALIIFGIRFEPIAENKADGTTVPVVRNVVLALVFVAVLLLLDRSQTFIYFRF